MLATRRTPILWLCSGRQLVRLSLLTIHRPSAAVPSGSLPSSWFAARLRYRRPFGSWGTPPDRPLPAADSCTSPGGRPLGSEPPMRELPDTYSSACWQSQDGVHAAIHASMRACVRGLYIACVAGTAKDSSQEGGGGRDSGCAHSLAVGVVDTRVVNLMPAHLDVHERRHVGHVLWQPACQAVV